MSSLIEPVLLNDFAPFLSVAMAINFVSSFWDGVRNKAVNNLDSHRDSFISELNAVYTSGDSERSESVVNLSNEAETYKQKLSWLSILATTISVLVVISLFILLAWIGFVPKQELTVAQAMLITSLSIIPSALLRAYGTYYSKISVNKLKIKSEIMKSAAKAAIQDNQQAAYKKSPKK
ncbi:hypothetical protein CWE12_02300 [Aliidiomarina sedimenti]|uniref:DUF2721 domain-containing protein n=1 Tax=Aliidiomarina sedimenti TaxID=1933879 RepID=A0ABY0C2G6_9GAMM|nr:hypothetical protein [Aliidiomarina sedimenti]RUO31849.1 hypothetical protein CWE12_02300 [Aliidiomarina sedimenti]